MHEDVLRLHTVLHTHVYIFCLLEISQFFIFMHGDVLRLQTALHTHVYMFALFNSNFFQFVNRLVVHGDVLRWHTALHTREYYPGGNLLVV